MCKSGQLSQDSALLLFHCFIWKCSRSTRPNLLFKETSSQLCVWKKCVIPVISLRALISIQAGNRAIRLPRSQNWQFITAVVKRNESGARNGGRTGTTSLFWMMKSPLQVLLWELKTPTKSRKVLLQTCTCLKKGQREEGRFNKQFKHK